MAVLVPIPLEVLHDFCNGGCGARTAFSFFPEPGEFTLHVICAGCGAPIDVPIHVVAVQDQLFHGFGDESSFSEVVTYGVLVLHSHDRKGAEDELARAKYRHGLPLETELHCREMFNEVARAKSIWTGWTEERLLGFLEEFLYALRKYRPMFLVSAVNRTEYPSSFPEGAGFAECEMEPKQLAAILFQGVCVLLFKRLGATNVRLWVDPDRTKIPWFGRRVQAHRNYRSTDPASKMFLEPQSLSEDDKPTLLEVADVFAYVAAHALSSTDHRLKRRYEELYYICRAELSVVTWDPEGKRVPSSLYDHHSRIFSLIRPTTSGA
jgi:hypothetical protein